MKENDQELCMKEISGEVLDSGNTVNISTLSENWGMSLKASADILEKWVKAHAGDRTFFKQFLVRGIQDDRSMLITIVAENNLTTVTKKLSKYLQMLYSIKEGTEPPAIIIPSFYDCKKKRLTVPCSERQSQFVAPEPEEKPVPVIKQEKPTVATSPFTKPSSKVTNGHASNNNIANMFKNVKTEPKTPTKEQSPSNNQKVSPKKKSPNKKDTGKKNGSIGSFFSSKPQSVKSSPAVEEPKKEQENIKEKQENIKEDSKVTKSEALNGKRSSVSSDHSENEKKSSESSDNPAKRRKVEDKKKARSKGSRIMLMVDSDEEDEPAAKVTSEDEDVEMAKSPTPEKKTDRSVDVEPTVNGSKPGRAKKRRIVTKTYEDEDGFIRTVKESEEYSSSEPEEADPAPKEKKESVIVKPEAKKKINSSPTKSNKAAARKTASKQGSIMNFFSKK